MQDWPRRSEGGNEQINSAVKVPQAVIHYLRSDFKGRVQSLNSMTSFMIQSHVGRQVPTAWAHNDTCPFCRIISGELPAQRVYETDKVIVILGIYLLVV